MQEQQDATTKSTNGICPRAVELLHTGSFVETRIPHAALHYDFPEISTRTGYVNQEPFFVIHI
jgi:hypothetical protein